MLGFYSHRKGLRVHSVAARNDIQLISMQFSIDCGATRNQIKLADIGRVKPISGNFNMATVDLITR